MFAAPAHDLLFDQGEYGDEQDGDRRQWRPLVQPVQPGQDVGGSLAGSKLHLLPGGQVLDGGEALPDLVLSQDNGVGDAELVRIGELLLELLPLRLDLGSLPYGLPVNDR